MIATIAEFERLWTQEAASTRKVFAALTDASLAQTVSPGGRTLGRLAWHVVGTIPEMAGKMGLHIGSPAEGAPVPASADAIRVAYDDASGSLLHQIRSGWTDPMLRVETAMYGESWTRAFSLTVLVHHQIHHRGQMTVLMRQAGLRVPGLYGPAREEWAGMGMKEPEI